MLNQNIDNYFFNNYDIRIDSSKHYDLTLSSDYSNYDSEVVFSDSIIANDDGNRLPINIDLTSTASTEQATLLWGVDYSGNTLVSTNYYNPNNESLVYLTATTLCDIGLVGTDNGLYSKMSGKTLTFTMGINEVEKFNPHYYDRRFKLHPVGTYATSPNERFSGNTPTLYNIVSKTGDTIEYYVELYGGFYQGFYKLFGYDYEVFPERVNNGWTAELMLKPRQTEEFTPSSGETYLNTIYPENSGIFFFMGARAENKYYHPASGLVRSGSTSGCSSNLVTFGDTGNTYTRVTEPLSGCIQTCACSDTGITNSNCVEVYPLTSTTVQHNIGGCGGAYNTTTINPVTDPAKDAYSNALAIRFSGDPKNPKLAVKVLTYTGGCTTTGSGLTTGLTYTSGYCVNEIVSDNGIYDVCGYNDSCQTGSTDERWVMISAVFQRNKNLTGCDLLNYGGLGSIREITYLSSLNGAAYNLIMPPFTRDNSTENVLNLIEINRKWLGEVDERKGTLKLYVNGYLFMTINDFEEIIPRELNTEKEKQIGVPFNISIGGGTQGLRESLIFSSCTATNGNYIQDPELMVNNTLSGTSLSGLTTNILLEKEFGGTFMGGLSQFRLYVEPLSAAQLQHNFRKLKTKYDLFDRWCENCYECQ